MEHVKLIYSNSFCIILFPSWKSYLSASDQVPIMMVCKQNLSEFLACFSLKITKYRFLGCFCNWFCIWCIFIGYFSHTREERVIQSSVLHLNYWRWHLLPSNFLSAMGRLLIGLTRAGQTFYLDTRTFCALGFAVPFSPSHGGLGSVWLGALCCMSLWKWITNSLKSPAKPAEAQLFILLSCCFLFLWGQT